MKRLKKKSAIEVQFNWIFVMIAGIAIFVFIISLIMSQKNTVENQLSQDVIKQLSTNIKGKQQLTNTFSQMEIPQTTLTFSCDYNTLLSDFKISGSQREPLPLEIIFAPREFNAKKLNIWTQDFNMPFIVTRFIYITPPNMIFVIYNSSATYQMQAVTIYDTLPSNITKKYASTPEQVNNAIKGYDYFRVICFDGNCPTPPEKYNYINILSTSNELFGYGKLEYGKTINPITSPNYIGAASLFGAIFSDSYQGGSYYKCQMARAFKQFEIKRTLHYQRMDLLSTELLTKNPECVPLFALPMSTLLNMKNKNLSDVSLLYNHSIQLKNDNTDFTFKGCPLIY